MEILMKTYDSHSKNLRYLLRYEDLLKNPLPELKKIYNFLDITVDEDTLKQLVNKFDFKNIPANEKGKGEFRRFASTGKWKENFNDNEKKLMNDILEEKLKKLGY